MKKTVLKKYRYGALLTLYRVLKENINYISHTDALKPGLCLYLSSHSLSLKSDQIRGRPFLGSHRDRCGTLSVTGA